MAGSIFYFMLLQCFEFCRTKYSSRYSTIIEYRSPPTFPEQRFDEVPSFPDDYRPQARRFVSLACLYRDGFAVLTPAIAEYTWRYLHDVVRFATLVTIYRHDNVALDSYIHTRRIKRARASWHVSVTINPRSSARERRDGSTDQPGNSVPGDSMGVDRPTSNRLGD